MEEWEEEGEEWEEGMGGGVGDRRGEREEGKKRSRRERRVIKKEEGEKTGVEGGIGREERRRCERIDQELCFHTFTFLNKCHPFTRLGTCRV